MDEGSLQAISQGGMKDSTLATAAAVSKYGPTKVKIFFPWTDTHYETHPINEMLRKYNHVISVAFKRIAKDSTSIGLNPTQNMN